MLRAGIACALVVLAACTRPITPTDPVTPSADLPAKPVTSSASPSPPPPPAPGPTASPPPPAHVTDEALAAACRELLQLMGGWAEVRTDPAPPERWWALAAVLLDALEQPGDEQRLALAGHLLFNLQGTPRLPDSFAARILTLASRRTPTCPSEGDVPDECRRDVLWEHAALDIVLARLVIGIDADRLGLFDEVRKLVARHPHTVFQTFLIEELRDSFPMSSARLRLLTDLVRDKDPIVQRLALNGLANDFSKRPPEVCAGLALGRASSSEEVRLLADIHLATSACGEATARALVELEALAKRGPMPQGRIELLCGYALSETDSFRPRAVLGAIALSAAQPLDQRRRAMIVARFCWQGDHKRVWRPLLFRLMHDPNKQVRNAAIEVDQMSADNGGAY